VIKKRNSPLPKEPGNTLLLDSDGHAIHVLTCRERDSSLLAGQLQRARVMNVAPVLVLAVCLVMMVTRTVAQVAGM